MTTTAAAALPRPHLRRQGTATQLLVDGQPFILLAGELHNSSASALAYVEPLLDQLIPLHLNAVLAPLSWELIEPDEGRFDFALVDGIIDAARRRRLRVVFLWFGTLKNAMSCYTPAWVKTDLARFPRAEAQPGVASGTVSPFGAEILRCDARAFAAVMRHIADIDAARHTVVMMQVENEPGILYASRDHSPAAERAFAAPVPEPLLAHLRQQTGTLIAELDEIWAATGRRAAGTWAEVFGEGADEVFMAWHTARFVDAVAAAGRAEHDLPMFANAWLIAGPGYKPGQYPSGGPVSKMLDVWRAAAPHIDVLAPDIYDPDFRGNAVSYTRSGNPLLVPETRSDTAAAAKALYAVGRHDAICFAPFGIDDLAAPHPLGETYRLLRDLMPLLTTAAGSGRMTGFLQQGDEENWTAEIAGFRFRCRTAKPMKDCTVPGGALLLHLEANEFIMAGRNLILTFEPLDPAQRTGELVWLDVGDYRGGQWVAGRRLNGDETAHGTGVLLGDALTVCRFELHAYR